jgi:flagellar assembly protein FliH
MNSSSDLARRRVRPLRGGAAVARFDEQFADPTKDRRGHATPEQAWTAGYEVGMEQGISVGRAAMVAEDAASDRRMATVSHALRGATQAAVANVQHEFALATEALLRASFDLALAIVNRDLRENPRTGEEALRSALGLVPPRVACVARLHPSDVDDLGSLDPALLHPDLSIVADYSVESGDCVVDLPSAQIENRLTEAIARVRAVLGNDVTEIGPQS